MKNRKKSLQFTFLLLIASLSTRCTSNITTDSVAGTYVVRNYDYTPFLTEIPYFGDTLVLRSNASFTSNHWGNGTYEIQNSMLNSKIKLNYNYEFGKASFRAKIKENDTEIKIILFDPKNHFYYKIN